MERPPGWERVFRFLTPFPSRPSRLMGVWNFRLGRSEIAMAIGGRHSQNKSQPSMQSLIGVIDGWLEALRRTPNNH